jgi:hypothetical protein
MSKEILVQGKTGKRVAKITNAEAACTFRLARLKPFLAFTEFKPA